MLSIIIPAKNESAGLAFFLERLRGKYPDAEVIVVDDGSSDRTFDVAADAGCRVVRHPYSKGNGAAIKTGARHATGDILVFMDGDGQHRTEDIPRLLAKLEEGYDMVVGARTSHKSQAGLHRAAANGFYNRFASWMTGHAVMDLTSGFRVVRASLFKRFLYMLPNGFSYPTTITMAFFRSGYSVVYEPIEVDKRIGKSHIRLWRDGVRFLLIIFKIGTLFSPLKLFLPISLVFFLTGIGYYIHTYLASGRFTNMSALLFITSILVFLIGLVSEQITSLMYRDRED
jgi:glycosyltransferase involved in cell wall biosynthesis